jgi:hypothetical protein
MPHVDQDSWSELRHANGAVGSGAGCGIRSHRCRSLLLAATTHSPTECAFRVGVKQALIMRAGKCPAMSARRIWPVVANSPRDYEKVRQAS